MKLPTKEQMNKQIKLVVFLVILFISVNYGPSVYARWNIRNNSNIAIDIIDNGISTIESANRDIDRIQEGARTDTGKQVNNGKIRRDPGTAISQRESLKPYPETKKERHDWILDYLSWEHPELKNEEINNLMLILEQENGNFDPNKGSTNKTAWGEQDGYGIGQILNSTWKLKPYKCKGDLYGSDAKTQLDCIVSIYKISGYGAWWTSAHTKLHII